MPNHSNSEGNSKAAHAAQAADRRNSERFPFSAVADVTEISSRSKVPVRIADIGRMGCYADSLNVFPIGTHVQLHIRHAGEVCQIGATVIYSLPGMGMGLNFAPLAPNMEATLTRWLAEARGEPESAPPLENPMTRATEARPPGTAAGTDQQVLTRLVKLLLRKGLLEDSECKGLLDDMSRHRRNGEGS